MKRVLFSFILLIFLSLSTIGLTEIEPVHLRQCGKSKDTALELQIGTLYYIEPMKDQLRWYSFTAPEDGQYTLFSESITGSAQTKVYNKYEEKMFDKNLVTGTSTMTCKTGETYHIYMRVYPSDKSFWFSICSPSQHVSFGPAEIRRPATCTTDGYMAQVCGYCHGEGEPVVIPAIGHQSGGKVTAKEATCLKTGLDTETCTHCGIVLSTIITPISDHEAGMWQDERYATCTSEGYRVQLCTGCNKLMDSQTVPALGHSVSEWKIEPARCVIDGKQYRDCTVCGAELEYEPISSRGHDFDDWIEILAPTTKAEGVEIRTCLSCGTEENRMVPVLTWFESIFGR